VFLHTEDDDDDEEALRLCFNTPTPIQQPPTNAPTTSIINLGTQGTKAHDKQSVASDSAMDIDMSEQGTDRHFVRQVETRRGTEDTRETTKRFKPEQPDSTAEPSPQPGAGAAQQDEPTTGDHTTHIGTTNMAAIPSNSSQADQTTNTSAVQEHQPVDEPQTTAKEPDPSPRPRSPITHPGTERRTVDRTTCDEDPTTTGSSPPTTEQRARLHQALVQP